MFACWRFCCRRKARGSIRLSRCGFMPSGKSLSRVENERKPKSSSGYVLFSTILFCRFLLHPKMSLEDAIYLRGKKCSYLFMKEIVSEQECPP